MAVILSHALKLKHLDYGIHISPTGLGTSHKAVEAADSVNIVSKYKSRTSPQSGTTPQDPVGAAHYFAENISYVILSTTLNRARG